MAKMIPEKLSADILEDPRKRGEVKVYNCFQIRLGNEWTVYYSVSWLAREFKSSNVRDGETDFIVTHPRYGIVVMEVKGGVSIEYDGNSDEWYSTSKGGMRNPIKDPYKQATANKYSLRNEMQSWRGWETGITGVNLCHAVIFPDTSNTYGPVPLHARPEITVYEDDLPNIAAKLVSIIHFSCNNIKTDENKTRQLIYDIHRNIAPSFQLKRKLANAMNEEEQEILTLTEHQYFLLRTLQKIPRASIGGCAGSGKTMLAIKKAEMMASGGYNTMLCCYNTLLGKEFSKLAKNIPGLCGGNFHSILFKILIEDLQFTPQQAYGILGDESKLLDTLIGMDLPRYDAIIIDEAQDFTESQLETVELMLAQGGVYYCFWDNNQRVLHADFKLPSNMQPYFLDTNLRNTEKIFNIVKKYYYQDTAIYHIGPEGRNIELRPNYNSYKAKELKQRITNEILNLVHQESVPPGDITVLTFKSKEGSSLNDLAIPGIELSIFNDEYTNKGVRIETIRRYKGLESSVVIVTEMDDYAATTDNELWDNLCYIAFSRAKHHLIIISPDSTKEKLIDSISQNSM